MDEVRDRVSPLLLGGLPPVATMIGRLRDLRDAQPFRPFVLHLADGRRIPVVDREFIMLVPSGRTVVVCHSDGSFDIVDVSLVTGVEAK